MKEDFAMIDAWFPTLIYSAFLPRDKFGKEFNQKIHDRVVEMRKINETGQNWNCDTYNTSRMPNIYTEPLFEDFVKECASHLVKLAKTYGVPDGMEVKVRDFWINHALPGAWQEYHIHPGSHFSLVYYAKAPIDCGNIVFRSYKDRDMFPIPSDGKASPGFTNCHYMPEPSKILIFPSNLEHMVKKNESKEDRVSIAINFVLEEHGENTV